MDNKRQEHISRIRRTWRRGRLSNRVACCHGVVRLAVTFVLAFVINALGAQYEKPHTWESFRGEWVGYDDSGRYFLLLTLDHSQRGACAVSFCRDVTQTYDVSAVTWEKTGGIRMTLVPTRKDEPSGHVEMAGGYAFDYAGLRLSSTGSVLSATFRLVRLDDLEKDIKILKGQMPVKKKPTQAENNKKAVNQSQESLVLRGFIDPYRSEVLNDDERVAVLQLLAKAKPPRYTFSWGTTSPSPHPRMTYCMDVVLSGHEQSFFFMDDGRLVNARLPEEKKRDLARIIAGVIGRMVKEEGTTTNQ